MRPEQAPPVKHLDFSREIIDLRSRTNLSEGYAAVFATIVIWSTPSLVQYFLNHYYDPWHRIFTAIWWPASPSHRFCFIGSSAAVRCKMRPATNRAWLW